MEQNNHKFRLRLNLFDAIILVAVLLVGAAAAWIGLRSGGEAAPTAAPVRWPPGWTPCWSTTPAAWTS